jgi:hypothetical protein
MAWTTPRTWVAGEVVTAAIMNQHVRDDLRYLKGLDGNVTIESNLLLVNGAALTPALAASADTNTGIYFDGADLLGFATGGVSRGSISSTGVWTLGTVTFTSGAIAGATTLSMTGDLTLNGGEALLNNGKRLRIKDTTGTYRDIVTLWIDDVIYLGAGSTIGSLIIRNGGINFTISSSGVAGYDRAVANQVKFGIGATKTEPGTTTQYGFVVDGTMTKSGGAAGEFRNTWFGMIPVVNAGATLDRAAQIYIEPVTATVNGTLSNHNGIYLGTPSGGTTVRVIDTASGAYLTTGGTWTNNPSWAELKEDIRPVEDSELAGLVDWFATQYKPVRYRYKTQKERYDMPTAYPHFGFLLDDMPAQIREIICDDPKGGISTKDTEGLLLALVSHLAKRIQVLEQTSRRQ